MKFITGILIILLFSNATYYVATDGNDTTGNGSISNPWATLSHAITEISGGDTVYLREGTYYPTDKFDFGSTQTGTANDRTAILAYPNEEVIFDFVNYDEPQYPAPPPHTVGNAYGAAFQFYGTGFISIKDFEVKNVAQVDSFTEITAIISQASHNLFFENIVVHDIGGRGFFHETPWGYPNEPEYDTTYFINCDAYNCADSLPYTFDVDPGEEGNQADGFKCYGEPGSVIYYTNCRAWNCSDDGWDPSGGIKYYYSNCWSFLNGHALYGDGNGFKLASHLDTTLYLADTVLRYMSNCISAYNDEPGYFWLEYPDYFRMNGRMYNCVSYEDRNAGISVSLNALPGRETIKWQIFNSIIYSAVYDPNNYEVGGAAVSAPYLDYTESHNNWDDIDGFPGWDYTDTITFDPATDWNGGGDSATIVNQLKAARQADGSLPVITCFNLVEGSDLIDAGRINIPDVGNLSYSGSAPDIGYAEWTPSDTHWVKFGKTMRYNGRTLFIKEE